MRSCMVDLHFALCFQWFHESRLSHFCKRFSPPKTLPVQLVQVPCVRQFSRVELICYLYANAGRIFSRDELLSKVWKCQQTMTIRTGDQTISSLRRKLGDHAESPRYLITVYGVGYTLGTFTSYAPESRKKARALR